MLNWANRFNICCLLDNHNYSSPYHSFECLAGVGAAKSFVIDAEFFSSLTTFVNDTNDWIFAHFNYDLKNRVEEGLSSTNPDEALFPEYNLFVPEILVQLQDNKVVIGVIDRNAKEIFKTISEEPVETAPITPLKLEPRISKEKYLGIIQKLKEHIHHGDCYEINFCQEFFAHQYISPKTAYNRLTNLSPNPFSCYYKLEDKYLLSASPERFLKKEGNRLISQPIKGTAPRNHSNAEVDSSNRERLYTSQKDRSENVMVVDLVRNDLSRVCVEGTVQVDELFGIYSFPNVHQMVSTVSGRVDSNLTFSEILRATFPMGSMTGAPKRSVMQLIEKYEESKRGIYSGTIGYISPDGDFDFNVVIRSLVYNETDGYLSFHVGSAITAYCDAEEEYNECLLKGEAMMKVFSA